MPELFALFFAGNSLRDRAAIAPHSPLPLLDELLTAEVAHRNQATRGDREKMISQIPPNHPGSARRPTLAIRGEPELTASDLARYLKSGSGAKGTRTPDPLLAKQVLFQLSYSPARRLPKDTRSACPRQGGGTSGVGGDPGRVPGGDPCPDPGAEPCADPADPSRGSPAFFPEASPVSEPPADPGTPGPAGPAGPPAALSTRPTAGSTITPAPSAASTPGSSAKLPSRWVAPARCSRSRVCPPVRIPATIWAPARRPHRMPLSVPPA